MEEALAAVLLLTTSLLVSSAIIHRASAETYTVGDGDRWSTGVNYLTWSEKHSYAVGDVLFFSYLRGQHDACEVTEETYRSCDSSAGVIARYATGQDRVTLMEARNHWFICSTAGHCAGGMKFGITVRGGHNATDGATAPDSQPAAPAPPSAAVARRGWWRTGMPCLLAAAGVLLHHYLPF